MSGVLALTSILRLVVVVVNVVFLVELLVRVAYGLVLSGLAHVRVQVVVAVSQLDELVLVVTYRRIVLQHRAFQGLHHLALDVPGICRLDRSIAHTFSTACHVEEELARIEPVDERVVNEAARLKGVVEWLVVRKRTLR